MAKTTQIQTFTKGLNKDASPFVLDASQLADVKNMLLERGLLHSRPGWVVVDSTTPDNSQCAAVCPQDFHPFVITPSDILVYQSGSPTGTVKIRGLVTTNLGGGFLSDATADLAGPALTLQSTGVRMVPFNGINMLVGFTNGVVRADSVAFTYTVPLATPYQFITVHLSRVIVGCAADGSIGALSKLAWCKIGDETVWSGTYDSGALILQEAEDGISGLGVMRNVVVVARPYGFHLGFPTGVGANPYDWKCFSKDAIGCTFPETFAKFGDKFFFASEADIHTFDMSNVEDIGEGIRGPLIDFVRTYGLGLRGFVTRAYKSNAHPTYHLVPFYKTFNGFNNLTSLPAQIPHFVYDTVEKTWSEHWYDLVTNDPLVLDAFPLNYLLVVNNSNRLYAASLPSLIRPAGTSGNRIINPAFAANVTDGWVLQNPVIPPANFIWDGGDGHTALGCARWYNFNPAQPMPAIQQDLDCPEGAVIAASCWVKSDVGEVTNFQMYIQYLDRWQQALATYLDVKAPTGGAWSQLLSTAPVAPAGTKWVRIILLPLYGTNGLGWKLDDVSLTTQRKKFSYIYWAPGSACESSQSFSTGRLELIGANAETTLIRAMLVFNVVAEAGIPAGVTQVSCTITNYLGNTTQISTVPITVPGYGWNRVWVNNLMVGQFFQLTFTFTYGMQVQVRQVVIEYEQAAQEVRV